MEMSREMLRAGGAHLATERSEEERSGAKWRGRGRGRRNTNFNQITNLSLDLVHLFCKEF